MWKGETTRKEVALISTRSRVLQHPGATGRQSLNDDSIDLDPYEGTATWCPYGNEYHKFVDSIDLDPYEGTATRNHAILRLLYRDSIDLDPYEGTATDSRSNNSDN